MVELRQVPSIPLSKTLAQLAFVGVGVSVAMPTSLQPLLHHDHTSSTSVGVMRAGMLLAAVIGGGLLPPSVAKANCARTFMIWTVR